MLTATKALFLLAPVAKAFGSGESKMPTSGMPMPDSRAWTFTVSSSHDSTASRGLSMTRTPIMRLALHLDISSEMIAPPKPNTAANTSSP